jgi:hypothetical protein
MDIPRYVTLDTDQNYTDDTSKAHIAAYCCHMFGSAFFLAAFTIIIFTWSTAFEGFGTQPRLRHLFRNTVLVAVNCVFTLLVVINCVVASHSGTLGRFFNHPTYMIFMWYAALVNILYSFGILWCICRTHKYRMIARQYAPNTSTKRVDHLLALMVVSSVCFFIRLVRIGVKMHTIQTSSPEEKRLYSVAWFVFGDFIPRAVPTFAFMSFMSTAGAGDDGSRAESSQDVAANSTAAGKLVIEVMEGPVIEESGLATGAVSLLA